MRKREGEPKVYMDEPGPTVETEDAALTFVGGPRPYIVARSVQDALILAVLWQIMDASMRGLPARISKPEVQK